MPSSRSGWLTRSVSFFGVPSTPSVYVMSARNCDGVPLGSYVAVNLSSESMQKGASPEPFTSLPGRNES